MEQTWVVQTGQPRAIAVLTILDQMNDQKKKKKNFYAKLVSKQQTV